MTRELTIVFGGNDAFRGKLRCKVGGLQREILPSLLKSEKMMPIDQAQGHIVSPIPLDKVNPKNSSLSSTSSSSSSELDLATINVMLTTMQVGMLLVDPLNPSQKYYFHPSKTSTLASLYRYHRDASAPQPPPQQFKSRLANAMLTKERRTSSSAATEPMDPSSSSSSLERYLDHTQSEKRRKLEPNPQAWMEAVIRHHHLQEQQQQDDTSTVPVTLELLETAMDQCLQDGRPTPQHLITQLVADYTIMQDATNKTVYKDLITTRLWMTDTALQRRVRSPDRDAAKLLRLIQVQTLLRLQLFCMGRDVFLRVFGKKLQSKKVKHTDPEGCLITDITAVFAHASFLLDKKKPLGVFLEETLTDSIYCSVPDAVQEIFDFFETPNPFVSDDDTDMTEWTSVVSPPKKLKRAPKHVTFADSTTQQAAAVPVRKQKNKVASHSLALTSTTSKTTTARPNPLLLQGTTTKPRYVGSHFHMGRSDTVPATMARVAFENDTSVSVPSVKNDVNRMLDQCRSVQRNLPPPPSAEKKPRPQSSTSATPILKRLDISEHDDNDDNDELDDKENHYSRQLTTPRNTGGSPFAVMGRNLSFDMDPVQRSHKSGIQAKAASKSTKSKRQIVSASRKPFSVSSRSNSGLTTAGDSTSSNSNSSSSEDMFKRSNARALALEALAASRRFR